MYPEIDPYASGMLDAGSGNLVYWEVCGNPDGKPAVVLHGGPGSGCSAWHRRLFDPAKYRVVLFDQRNCGRSLPHASDPRTDLAANTTAHLLDDLELLRESLAIDRWLILGGSWGSTLALAYAETHPERVSEIVLSGVTTGRHNEFDWLFRGGVAIFFPEQWEQLRQGMPAALRAPDIVEAYSQLLNDSDPAIRHQAALNWCQWESVTPAWPPVRGLSPRFSDPAFRMAFARVVTHYVRHNAWLEDGILLRNAHRLEAIPGILINGRFDLQAPIGWAWDLKQAWPGACLTIVDNAGHDASHTAIATELVAATDHFAED